MTLPDYLVDDLTRRVDDHLVRIAARDFDYFAIQKYRNDAKLALSDFRRLEKHWRKKQAATGEAVLSARERGS